MKKLLLLLWIAYPCLSYSQTVVSKFSILGSRNYISKSSMRGTIDNTSQNTFVISPNPGNKLILITFSSLNDLQKLVIYSVSGEVLDIISNVSEPKFYYDVSKYKDGIYLVSAVFKDSIASSKFIKN